MQQNFYGNQYYYYRPDAVTLRALGRNALAGNGKVLLLR